MRYAFVLLGLLWSGRTDLLTTMVDGVWDGRSFLERGAGVAGSCCA
jgi:hypothetical protein